MENYRLKSGARPLSYNLFLIPEADESRISGRVEIDLEIESPDNYLEINARDIVPSSICLTNKSGTMLEGQWTLDKSREIARIHFNGRFGAGAWQLSIEYQGEIDDQLLGLYKSSWKDEKDVACQLLTTHFEPVHARSVFPCFDEPSYKTPFLISVLADKNLNCLSNGKLLVGNQPTGDDRVKEAEYFTKYLESLDEDRRGNLRTFSFDSTVAISAYLVAFVLGPIHSSDPVFVNGVEIRVWSKVTEEKKRRKLSEFALGAAAFAINFYEDYFAIKYPGDKIDLIALPDFPIGAMENMACITFREDALLINPEDTTRSSLVRVAEIVMHELAHMWFGNLVTMNWWNGLWLKESFATFMANLCLDSWKPEWHVWTSFATTRLAAMSLDSLESTHPIESSVGHPDEATEMFDMISYNKGCSVLYQLHELIGADTFRRGCEIYLERYQGKSTDTHCLWDALAEACSQAAVSHPVSELMHDWVFQDGHPILKVNRSGPSPFLEIEQKRFLLFSSDSGSDSGERNSMAGGASSNSDCVHSDTAHNTITKWRIPLFLRTYREGNVRNKYQTISKEKERIYIPTDLDHFMLNADGAGFYRVVYSPEIYHELENKLFSHVSHIERFNLVNDLWMACLADEYEVTIFLEFLRHYQHDTEPQIWLFIQSVCSQLRRLLDSQDSISGFKNYARELTRVNLNELGLTTREEDTQVDKELRAVTLSINGNLAEDSHTREQARILYNKVLSSEISLDPELKAELVKLVASNGDEELYENFLSLAASAESPQESSRFTYALAQFQNRSLVERTLTHCLDSTIRSQDAPFLISRILNSAFNSDLAWAFIKENFSHINSHYPPISVRKMCSQLMHLDRDDTVSDIVNFFSAQSDSVGDKSNNNSGTKGGNRSVRQMLESLLANQRFRSKNSDKLETYFSKLS